MPGLLALVATGIVVAACAATARTEESHSPLKPAVEVEEDVYRYEPADNGADPMWCWGSSCLARLGGDVFASGSETLNQFKPMNNVRWVLYRRGAQGWERQQADEKGRTREPCPIALFPDGQLFLSANPTLVADGQAAGGGPARRDVLRFSARDPKAGCETLLPQWEGKPAFSEHSYRTFAADGPRRELVLIQNVGYDWAEWAFRDRDGKWSAHGQLHWPPAGASRPGELIPRPHTAEDAA